MVVDAAARLYNLYILTILFIGHHKPNQLTLYIKNRQSMFFPKILAANFYDLRRRSYKRLTQSTFFSYDPVLRLIFFFSRYFLNSNGDRRIKMDALYHLTNAIASVDMLDLLSPFSTFYYSFYSGWT